MSCKSPTHRAYTHALENLDVALGLIAKDIVEARTLPQDSAERHVAVQRVADDAQERIQWAQRIVSDATREVNAHFDRGCSNLQRALVPATRDI